MRQVDTVQAFGQSQSYFKQLLACLVLILTDRTYHSTFHQRDEQLLFPHLPSDEAY